MQEAIAFITSTKTLISLAIIILTLVLNRLLSGFRRRLLNPQKPGASPVRNERLAHALFTLARWILLIVCVLTVLQVNGINVSSLVASLGLVSAVVGLALQDLLKDMIMGFHILTDHFFSVGDAVEYDGIESEVVSFGAKTTKLKSLRDGAVRSVCNRNITEMTLISENNDLELPLAYEEPAARVDAVLEALAGEIAALPGIDECVYLGTLRFADSAIVYLLRFRCVPARRFELRLQALRRAQLSLEKAGLQIPYPQLDIHGEPDGRALGRRAR